MAFQSPYPPYDPTDKNGYETVVKRWPVIVTGVVDQLHSACHTLSLESRELDVDTQPIENKIAAGRSIIEKLSRLKYKMGRDHSLEPIPVDGEPFIEEYNLELKRLAEIRKDTWFTAPWLFAECYLYRFIRSFFASTNHWRDYDPFFTQKMTTFSQSGTSILKIATSMHELEMDDAALSGDNLGVLFKEMVQMCLWGNATDLSLLTHLSPADMEHLQSVGKDAQAVRKQFILRDDQDRLWKHVRGLKNARLDFVLDNAGFEVFNSIRGCTKKSHARLKLFTDFVLADFLVTYTPHVSKVVFHPKLIPWFVSDVTPADFQKTITSLLDPTFLSQFAVNDGKVSTPSLEHLRHLAMRWKSYFDQGIFDLSVPLDTVLGGSKAAGLADFWTGPWPYWDMRLHAPELFATLRRSNLVIFKGDLNYRKLTGDVQWPAWTPFDTALGPLAGSFPLLSLRTNKASVVVGIDRDVAEGLDKSGELWRWNGRYALISFLDASRS